jgi:hypothetical protein
MSLDEGKRRAAGTLGCALDGSAPVAEAPVEEQRGVPMGGCLDRCGELRRPRRFGCP